MDHLRTDAQQIKLAAGELQGELPTKQVLHRHAMRTGTAEPKWLLGDHLGSTSVVVNEQGVPVNGSPQLYKAWGEQRFPEGGSPLPTTFRYIGQRENSHIKLYWYDAYSPDIIPFALRKLDVLAAAHALSDLSSPPGNR